MSGVEPFLLLSMATTAAGTGVALLGQAQASKEQQRIAEADAQAAERQAVAERASAQRRAEIERQKGEQLMSRQRAVAAASGGGLEGSVLEILGNTAAKGELNSDLALWEGEEKGRKLENEAILKRQAAKGAASAAKIGMASTLISGVGQMASLGMKTGGGKGTSGDLHYGSDSWKTEVKPASRWG